MIIDYDNEMVIVPEPEPLHLNLKHQAKVEAILILREDFRLTHRAIGERLGLAETTITNLINHE